MESVMSNIESVVESVDVIIDAYVASWNETDPAKRKSALAASCAAGASYRDPVMVSDGQAGLDAMLAGVQAKFPGFVLKRISKVDSHNGAVRFAWSLGPASGPSVVEGVDFATLSADGKLASIVGFIDKMPG
jgi:SnoaL-like protein